MNELAFAPAAQCPTHGETGSRPAESPQHLVQFYDDDTVLVDSIAEFLAATLRAGHGALLISTRSHREAVTQALAKLGFDPTALHEAGQYLPLDAADTLAKFMVDGHPDRDRFRQAVGTAITQLGMRYPHVQAYGEMVALLWMQGYMEAALELETLWNELASTHAFSLRCAYPLGGFSSHVHSEPFLQVCALHSQVLPAGAAPAHADSDEHLRLVAELQQKTQALSSEIREHQQTLETLRRREHELADFLEHGVESMHQVGPDGTILWANEAELSLLGYTRDEYIGRPIADFHADGEIIEDILTRLLRGDTLRDYPARLRCKDGSIRHVLIHSNARVEDGKFVHTRCFTRDVTDRVHLEDLLHDRLRELADADQRKDEFLAMLGHELRNPLSPILAALEILRLPGADAVAVRTAHDAIGHQTRHLARIVDDLLDVTRINSGKIQLRNELVDLATAVQRSIETVRPLLDANRHRLTVSLPDHTVLVNGDATRLEQVFTNLLTNAAKYMNQFGHISLIAELRADAEVVVSVEDRGVGITAELLPRIFELFIQAERPLDRSHGGLGIGLWMARKLVELHRGKVTAYSAGAGKGSTFSVHLPVARRQQAATPPAGAASVEPDSAQLYRIMVVDDNRDSAEMLAILLRMAGHDVHTAHDGLAALQIASTFHPDVALLDIGLPGLDGYGVARALKETSSDHPIVLIAITGYGQEEDRRRSREAGFDHHLVKPVEPGQLLELLARSRAELIGH